MHRAGDHPGVFYDPLSILSSRRLEKPNACVSGLRDKFKKHCWNRQGFWIFEIYNRNMLHHKKRLLGRDVFAVGREEDWIWIWIFQSSYLSREGWLSMHECAAVPYFILTMFHTFMSEVFICWLLSSSSRGLRGPMPCSRAFMQT